MIKHVTRRHQPLRSLALSLDDVVRVYRKLSNCVREQADAHIAEFRQQQKVINEREFAEFMDGASTAYLVTVTITGSDGSSLIAQDEEIFRSPELPDRIASIYMSNATAFANRFKFRPINAVEVLLDFGKPPLLDSSNQVSAPTPNNSYALIEGDRNSWVASVADAIRPITEARRTNRGWLHAGFSYDVGVLIVVVPAALYVSWRASSMVEHFLSPVHPLVPAAAYLYLFFCSLLAYRALYGYAKWGFPTMELTYNRDPLLRHRAILGTVLLTMVGNLIWSLIGG